MKLKLLIAPLLVLLIIITAIWAVAPAYRGLVAQKEELAAAKLKLAGIQEENAQAAKLRQDLAGNTEHKDLLLKYIPQTAQEETVIENLNALALGEGLAIFNLSMADNSRKNSVPAVSATVNNSQGETAPAVLSADSISVSVGFAGPYEKIKSFIGKLAALKRGNNITSLKIAAAAETAGSLQGDMVLKFSYFAGSNSAISANSSVFSKGSFDTAVIEQIKSRLNTEVVPVNIGETGKANPFLP